MSDGVYNQEYWKSRNGDAVVKSIFYRDYCLSDFIAANRYNLLGVQRRTGVRKLHEAGEEIFSLIIDIDQKFFEETNKVLLLVLETLNVLRDEDPNKLSAIATIMYNGNKVEILEVSTILIDSLGNFKRVEIATQAITNAEFEINMLMSRYDKENY